MASRGEVGVTEVKVKSGTLIITFGGVRLMLLYPGPQLGAGFGRRCVEPVVLTGKQHHPNPRFQH